MFKELWTKNFKGDRTIWIIYFALLMFSIVEVYSATSSLAYGAVYKGNYNGPILKHIVICLGSAALAFFFHNINIRRLGKFTAWWIFPLCLAWVVFVSITGDSVNSASRWSKIPYLGITIQPSEFLKLAFIITAGYFFSSYASQERELNLKLWKFRFSKQFRAYCFITLLAAGSIVGENISTAALVFVTAILLWITVYKKLKLLLILLIIAACGAFFAKFVVGTDGFKSFTKGASKISVIGPLFNRVETMSGRLDRFYNMKEPGEEGFVIDDKNFQSIHGKIAIANSYGIGVLPGRSKERDVLPQAYSDFIYALIIEETGILGGTFVLLLYLLLLYRIGKMIALCQSQFCAIIAAGIGFMLSIQALINMSVSVGLIPVTGQTLPLISRGGSSQIFTSLHFAILLSISHFDCGINSKKEEKAVAETETKEEEGDDLA